MYSCAGLAEARGFPIRKFTDQSLFAAPRNLSQRTTSFIASQCQGIHQMLLSRLMLSLSMPICGVRPRQIERTDSDLRKTLLCSICLSRSGQAPCPASRRHTSKSLHSRCQSAIRTLRKVAKLVIGRRPDAGCHNGLSLGGGARRDRTDDLKLAKLPLSQLSYGPVRPPVPIERSWPNRNMVGLGRFELPTSRLSSARSNQLSYRPERLSLHCAT